MKDRRGGAAAGFPFSIGCTSHPAVSVVANALDKKQPQPLPLPLPLPLPHTVASSSTAATAPKAAAAGPEEERSVGGSGEEKAVAAPAPGIVAAGVQRLIKGIKSLTHIFAAAYNGGEEEENDEEEEREIVIGYPSDVVHVGHIGWDGGLSKVGGMGSAAFSQLPSSLSLRRLEIAMEAASHA